MLFSPTFVYVNLMSNAFQVLIKMVCKMLASISWRHFAYLHVNLKGLFCTGDVIARKKVNWYWSFNTYIQTVLNSLTTELKVLKFKNKIHFLVGSMGRPILASMILEIFTGPI